MDDATLRELHDIVARALAEDVGGGDLTSLATVPAEARARATVSQKDQGVVFGLDVAEHALRSLDPDCSIERLTQEEIGRAHV